MRSRLSDQRGQASVELVAMLPLVAALAFALWQLALAGQAIWLAGAAARAGARAEAVGGDPGEAARGALPASLEHGLRVHVGHDHAVSVEVGVPLVVGGGRLATVEHSARFEPQAP